MNVRPIKYKAWHKTNQVMYDVSGLAFYNKLCEVFDPEVNDRIRILGFALEDVILLQYTGKKDKNSKKIYEGDIWEGYKNFVVKYNEDYAGFKPFVNDGGCGCCSDDDLGQIAESGEVIGNIYEDKHLLEGAHND